MVRGGGQSGVKGLVVLSQPIPREPQVIRPCWPAARGMWPLASFGAVAWPLLPSVTADLGSWLMLLQGTEPRNGCPAACSRGSCAGAPLSGVAEGTARFRE